MAKNFKRKMTFKGNIRSFKRITGATKDPTRIAKNLNKVNIFMDNLFQMPSSASCFE